MRCSRRGTSPVHRHRQTARRRQVRDLSRQCLVSHPRRVAPGGLGMGWNEQIRSNRVGLRSNRNRSRHVTRLDRAFWNRRSGFVYHMSVDGADRCAELPTALRHFFGVKVLGIPVFPLPRRIGMPGGLQPNRMAHDTVGQEGPSRCHWTPPHSSLSKREVPCRKTPESEPAITNLPRFHKRPPEGAESLSRRVERSDPRGKPLAAQRLPE